MSPKVSDKTNPSHDDAGFSTSYNGYGLKDGMSSKEMWDRILKPTRNFWIQQNWKFPRRKFVERTHVENDISKTSGSVLESSIQLETSDQEDEPDSSPKNSISTETESEKDRMKEQPVKIKMELSESIDQIPNAIHTEIDIKEEFVDCPMETVSHSKSLSTNLNDHTLRNWRDNVKLIAEQNEQIRLMEIEQKEFKVRISELKSSIEDIIADNSDSSED